ncbi:unknown [Candidatus Apopatosoma intestinale]|nr:unknown [Candidatus Apopatosoma intestinale]
MLSRLVVCKLVVVPKEGDKPVGTGICVFKVVFQLRIISENKLLFIHRVFLRGADGIQRLLYIRALRDKLRSRVLVFSELAGESRRLASQFLYLLFVFGGLSYRLRYRFFERSRSGTVNLRLCLHSLEKRCEKLRIRLFSCQLYEQVAALILQFFKLFLKRSTLTVYLVFLEGK